MANDGPEMTAIFSVFSIFLTMSYTKRLLSCSIPLVAIQTGVFV